METPDGATVKELVFLRETYAGIRKNVAADQTSPAEVALGTKLRTYFTPVSAMSIGGKPVTLSPEFSTTASPRMDAAALSYEAAFKAWRANPSPTAVATLTAARSELRSAQRQHLENDPQLKPLFQQLDQLRREANGPPSPQRTQAFHRLVDAEGDVESILRNQSTTLYGVEF